ncbi:MAG: lipopolysaccharide heptosyltransferase II [Pirellulaceae bacterium]
MRIGVLMPNWVGDVVMATPALRLLRERLPDADLVGIMRPVAAEVLAGVPWFRDVVYYDRRSDQPEQRMWPVIRQLQEQRLDSIVLFPNSLRSAFVAWRSGTRERIGIARNGRGLILTRAVRHPRRYFREPVSAMEVYRHLVSQWVGGKTKYPPQLMTTSHERALADEVWQNAGWKKSEKVVVLNSGGAYGPAKDWPLRSFVTLSHRLVAELGTKVLMVCGPAERENAAQFVKLADRDEIQSTASLPPSIGRTKACIQRAAMMISTDSGPRHFAAGYNVPVVALFGPTDDRWSLNDHPNETRLANDELACRPCAKRTCPLGHHRCMTDLSVERVMRATQQRWSAFRNKLNAA